MSKKAILSEQEEWTAPTSSSSREFDAEKIRQAVSGIRFGEVRLIIQDGVIVQIDRVEKQRLR